MLHWKRPDLLAEDASRIDYDAICSVRRERLSGLTGKNWTVARALFNQLPSEIVAPAIVQRESGIVSIGEQDSLTPNEHQVVLNTIKALVPWRKGPFELFGVPIDAEWRSNLKWDRLEACLGNISGQRVADIGCNNGYYLFRLATLKPRIVVGLDPSERGWYQFELFQRFVRNPTLIYDLLGIENLGLFPNYFDTMLCCGVLSHQRNPLDHLRSLREALAPGGLLVIENLAIAGSGAMALCVPDRYACMRNVYLIPTPDGLVAWLEKSGFKNIRVHSMVPTTVDEQRQTELAPYQSLEHFLDPGDPTKTVEGFPAPHRIIVTATKPVGRVKKKMES